MIRGFLAGLLFAIACGVAQAAIAPEDRLVFYDMKEDPTVAQFIANTSIKGFYGLVIDEYKGEASILYRVDDVLYRADADLRVKGNQLILRNGKRRKTYVRDVSTSPLGVTQEVVTPIECPSSSNGWRRGGSFGKHDLRRGDEMGERLLTGSVKLQFEIALQRCEDAGNDCGPVGCAEMGAVASSSSTAVHVSTGPLPLSQVLLEAKLGAQDVLTKYKTEINNALPQKLSDLSAVTTSYHTTALPYFGMPDPFIDQRGFKIGVVSKSYASETKPEPVVVEVEPLLAEFQDPSTTKCGSWETAPNKTPFDLRGRPAIYVQTPATGNAPVYSGIAVCGRTMSVTLHTESYRSKDELAPYLDALPLEQMERIVGGSK
jgi:hypothetical protein